MIKMQKLMKLTMRMIADSMKSRTQIQLKTRNKTVRISLAKLETVVLMVRKLLKLKLWRRVETIVRVL